MWFLFVHGIFAIWVLNDGLKRKVNIIPWLMLIVIFGPIAFPEYISRCSIKPGEHKKNKRLMRFFKSLAVFWALLLAITGIWSRQFKTNTIQNETLEYKLAVLDAKDSNCNDEATVERFRDLLDQLANICVENREQIANLSLIARNGVKRNGIDESLFKIMDDLNKLCMGRNLRQQKFSEYVLAYTSLRNGGLSHIEAIERLQSIEKGY